MIAAMSGSLFERTNNGAEPLAARMRPRTLDEFVGQEHILGPGRLLRRSIQADMLSSLIFYGPPGTGKTTLARVIANTTRSDFISLNAVLSGVKDVRIAIEKARNNLDYHDRRTILFVDEVHRWNKAQQDALLPWVENGTVILIGATTHNPFFEVNSALVSRSRIFQLKPLTNADLGMIVDNVLSNRERGYGRIEVQIDEDARDHLVAVANGDARALLGALQLAVETTANPYPPPDGTVLRIDRSIAEESIQKKAVLYDKEGDVHFDVISAFIKSLRGSDPDAALYWMAKMVHSGEDPRYIFRRMLIAASEDIGLADPYALGVVEAAAASFERVGMPEGRFFLAHAALYLATCAKSNSTLGFFDALEAVEKEPSGEVPNPMRDANRDSEGFGHGEGYLYPHAFRDHWVAQAYLPASLRGRVFYEPGDQGYERDVRDAVLEHREMQLELGFEEESSEILTFSRDSDRELDRWISRTERGTESVQAVRDAVTETARIARHHRVLVVGPNPLLLVWAALRLAPEGIVAAYIGDPRRLEIARHHAARAHPLLSPVVTGGEESTLDEFLDLDRRDDTLTGVKFDRILMDRPDRQIGDPQLIAERITATAAANAVICVSRPAAADGMRLSGLAALDERERAALIAAEDHLYAQARSDEPYSRFKAGLATNGWSFGEPRSVETGESRIISKETLLNWFNPDRPGLGSVIREQTNAAMLESVSAAVIAELANQAVQWRNRLTIDVAGFNGAVD